LALDLVRIGQHTEAAVERYLLQLGSSMKDKSITEKDALTEICVPSNFSEHLDRALVRLAYLFPEFQITRGDLDQKTIQVRYTAKLDIEAFSRELHHALAREKIRSEGEPLRRALLHSIFEE
jgi:hypothetical protein